MAEKLSGDGHARQVVWVRSLVMPKLGWKW